MIYQHSASALHIVRAPIGLLYCTVLVTLALAFGNPVILVSLAIAVSAVAWATHTVRTVAKSALWSIPFVLVLFVINVFVSSRGHSVVFDLGRVPFFGEIEVTGECLLASGVIALRTIIIFVCFAIYCAAINPDDLLRSLRCLSFRSALTATVATRMIPLLRRDGVRLSEAQRCRGRKLSRTAAISAVMTNALERSLQISATLELRGYSSDAKAGRTKRPWSRHDAMFSAISAVLLILTICALTSHWGRFSTYPTISVDASATTVIFAVALMVGMLVPFFDRRGIAERRR